MSTKEMLLHEIDAMNEKQLQGLLLFIQGCYAEIPNEETRSVLDDLKQGKNMVGTVFFREGTHGGLRC